jgi:predicted short-subunit dehydrogenase-like oxidoreductase (DUF2520 family)
MKSLNIIGCGNVGKVLGRLFHEAGIFEIRGILNRSRSSAEGAAAFIGAGCALSGYDEMSAADLYLIASSDDAIAGSAEALAASGLAIKGRVVFHVSGALPGSILAPVQALGGEVASVHPVKSFANPAESVQSFEGTWCGVEGDAAAAAELTEAFTAIGARPFPVDSRYKAIYHAGSVFVCNYLASLMEVGLRAYEKGGLPRETALQVMEPLVRGTLDNVFAMGPAQALTGPIARGDAAVVGRQLEALEEWDHEVADIYKGLGRVALSLARQRAEEKGKPGFGDLEKLLAGKD